MLEMSNLMYADQVDKILNRNMMARASDVGYGGTFADKGFPEDAELEKQLTEQFKDKESTKLPLGFTPKEAKKRTNAESVQDKVDAKAEKYFGKIKPAPYDEQFPLKHFVDGNEVTGDVWAKKYGIPVESTKKVEKVNMMAFSENRNHLDNNGSKGDCHDLIGDKWSIPPNEHVRYIYRDIAAGGKDCVRTDKDYGEQGDRGMYPNPPRNGTEPKEVGRDMLNDPFFIENPWKDHKGSFDFTVKDKVAEMKVEDDAYHK